MSIPNLALLGGVWLSLLYAAGVMPASVWTIQVTVSSGSKQGIVALWGIALGTAPWCLAAALILFNFPRLWQFLDLPLRLGASVFLVWMAACCWKASEVQSLRPGTLAEGESLFRVSFWRSLVMPWRLALWASFILSVGIHLRGPGSLAALFFTFGALIGQVLWHGHFLVIAGLFGHSVPEAVSLKSLNKLRILAVTVFSGLALVILAPVAFPPV